MRTYPNVPDGVWALAVDYGTTNTVAAVGDATGVRTLTFEGQTTLPSAVLLHDGGPGSGESWLVGHRAVNMAQLQIERFEGTPKRWISAGTVFLAGRAIPLVEAVAAVLQVVVAKAVADNGPRPPARFIITHPADWPEAWIEVLREAARRARQRGWPDPETMSEPVAAAYRALENPQVPSEARIVVLDIGGGTIDVAVVDRSDTQLTVVGRPRGMPGAAGETFDTRLAGWMTTAAGADGLYQRLTESEEHDDKERAHRIRTTARAVKEELSRQGIVPASLPAALPELEHDTAVEVRRANLEELVRGGRGQEPGLTEAVAMVDEAVRAAPPGRPFAGVLLVGGSSRIPLLGRLVRERSGKQAISEGDPSTAVAEGAVARALDELDRVPPPHLWQRIAARKSRRVTLPWRRWRRSRKPSLTTPSPSDQAAPPRSGTGPGEPAPRRINVAIVGPAAPNERPRQVTAPLVLGGTYLLQFGIGTDLIGNVVTSGAPMFPVALLTPDSPQGYWLTVNVRGDGLQIPPGPHPVFLPHQGPSWVCDCARGQPHRCRPGTRSAVLELPFLAPRRQGRYTLLVSVYAGATLVQAVRVRLPVAIPTSERPSATVTFTLGSDPAVVAAHPSRTLSILSEPAPNGHRLHVNGEWPGPPIMFEFPDAAAREAASHLRTLLFNTHLHRSGDGWASRHRPDLSTDLPTYTEDLQRLAVAGSEVFLGAFGGQGPGLRHALASVERTNGSPAEIQLARAVNTRLTVPWQLVYDEPIDDTRDPAICPSVAQFGPGSHAASTPTGIPAECPHPSAHEPGRGTLCPFGFWGLAHHLECLPASFTRPLPDTTGTQCPASLTVALHPDLATTTWPAHARALRMLDSSSPVHSSLEALRHAVLAGTDVLYFYCHGVRVDRPGSSAPRAVLDLGPGGRLSPLTLDTWTSGHPKVRWDNRRPLVVLNGCHTGEMLPDTTVDLVTAFVNGVGAAGVIATEITLDAALAAPAIELFLRPLFAGATVAAAIRAMRWELLARGNLLGLAYSPYCDARLHLPRPPTATRPASGRREENRP